jgi:hypothetical protein
MSCSRSRSYRGGTADGRPGPGAPLHGEQSGVELVNHHLYLVPGALDDKVIGAESTNELVADRSEAGAVRELPGGANRAAGTSAVNSSRTSGGNKSPRTSR